VEIIEVLVNVGDQINQNDPVVTLESDKSSVEVPSPFSGKILELNVKVGDKVAKGSLLAKLDINQSDVSEKEKKPNNPDAYKSRTNWEFGLNTPRTTPSYILFLNS
jgi:pyruvate/2-oxoglutarate dehydrogenase complex dihydrolipoamide acyltransferase (E2) component